MCYDRRMYDGALGGDIEEVHSGAFGRNHLLFLTNFYEYYEAVGETIPGTTYARHYGTHHDRITIFVLEGVVVAGHGGIVRRGLHF